MAEQLTAAGQGDTDAFAELYDQVVPRIYGLAFRILRDQHQAEEVAQEVLLQVWQHADRFDARRGSALGWVLTIAHRRAVDRVRSVEGSVRREQNDYVMSPQAPRDVTSESAQTTLDGQWVRAALATLSPTQRRALELAYLDGYTHTEVSHLMHTPLGTAKTRIRQGLIRLREHMDATNYEAN